MKPITVNLERFETMHAWANRILRIDLSDMRIWAQETAPYVPAYLGARGIAARICWDEYPEPVGRVRPRQPADGLARGADRLARALFGAHQRLRLQPAGLPLSLVHPLQHRRALWRRAQARRL